MTPEAKVKKMIRDLAKSFRPYIFDTPQVMSAITRRGTPDILWCLGGLFIGIEVKADAKSRFSKLQVEKLQAIHDAGGVAVGVHAGNFEDFERCVSEFVNHIRTSMAILGVHEDVPIRNKYCHFFDFEESLTKWKKK
ncbi:MAG: hypothetical protein LBS60_08775 [Deltaproteobacteria bacterium]|nr:hypothetical protein [Deltaproteobacteria bacterium]